MMEVFSLDINKEPTKQVYHMHSTGHLKNSQVAVLQ